MQTDIHVDDETAVAACRRARADLAAGGERLRHVHEAGRLLRAVAKTPGVRQLGLTRLQTITREAGVSRQTANTWQQVGDVPSDLLNKFIAECEAAGIEITMSGFLKAFTPETKADDPAFTISLGKLSDKQRERFKHEIRELRATFGAETDGEAIVEGISRLYREFLSRRCAA